jgi:hypothetical protein
MSLQVIDKWTTQHGTWDIKASNKWGIDQQHRDLYLAGRLIPGAGADHHIMVGAPVGALIEFRTSGGLQLPPITVGANGWVNQPLSRDASFDPDKGGARAVGSLG